MAEALEPLFRDLRARMLRAAEGMRIAKDEPGDLVLVANWPNPRHPKQPMFFGQVTNKSYISVHLLPLYASPKLQARVSPALLKRKQGKACFNFKTDDPALFVELEDLIRVCAHAFAQPVDFAGTSCD